MSASSRPMSASQSIDIPAQPASPSIGGLAKVVRTGFHVRKPPSGRGPVESTTPPSHGVGGSSAPSSPCGSPREFDPPSCFFDKASLRVSIPKSPFDGISRARHHNKQHTLTGEEEAESPTPLDLDGAGGHALAIKPNLMRSISAPSPKVVSPNESPPGSAYSSPPGSRPVSTPTTPRTPRAEQYLLGRQKNRRTSFVTTMERISFLSLDQDYFDEDNESRRVVESVVCPTDQACKGAVLSEVRELVAEHTLLHMSPDLPDYNDNSVVSSRRASLSSGYNTTASTPDLLVSPDSMHPLDDLPPMRHAIRRHRLSETSEDAAGDAGHLLCWVELKRKDSEIDPSIFKKFSYQDLEDLVQQMKHAGEPETGTGTTGVKVADHRWRNVTYCNSFLGSEAADWMVKYLRTSWGVRDRKTATALGQSLLDCHFIRRVDASPTTSSSKRGQQDVFRATRKFYEFCQHQPQQVLNSLGKDAMPVMDFSLGPSQHDQAAEPLSLRMLSPPKKQLHHRALTALGVLQDQNKQQQHQQAAALPQAVARLKTGGGQTHHRRSKSASASDSRQKKQLQRALSSRSRNASPTRSKKAAAAAAAAAAAGKPPLLDTTDAAGEAPPRVRGRSRLSKQLSSFGFESSPRSTSTTTTTATSCPSSPLRKRSGSQRRAPNDIAIEALRRVQALFKTTVVVGAGGGIDAVRRIPTQLSTEFGEFVSVVVSLRQIDLRALGDKHEALVAFWANVFNVLMMHAIIACGLPEKRKRPAWLREVCYVVGGHVYSLMDIQHGVLRAPMKMPEMKHSDRLLMFPPRFRNNDPRREFCVKFPEPRISFVLCSGHASSPLLFQLESDILDRVLTLAVQSYLARFVSSETATQPVQRLKVVVPKLFDWHRLDFGRNPESVLQWIAEHHWDVFVKSRIADFLSARNFEMSITRFDWSVDLTCFCGNLDEQPTFESA